ncbi:hypothetical protein ROZALSC1DRAFT_30915 [Rozella allomycis CSF55]|uniref:Uncharacterized protein n=1 Tax=Rozella allomycis (strain CSF55) TaxID=988480 RepID=A0A075ARZ1_ROZAC|nr:hypothetical protein O9G_005032 [Rozella allomycis CSF55]RKP17255.1 hypothetical protein ROZALSC1DRAFT_30915 [Rozella allomycis CSF55]|eukprot:EPZ33036.1 hypothetical protein O9G_005032 [Rozella allomycis CSF55]
MGFVFNDYPPYRDRTDKIGRSQFIVGFVIMLCIIVSVRSHMIITEERRRHIMLGINFVLSGLIVGFSISVVYTHFYREFETDPALKKAYFSALSSSNMIQTIFTSLMVIGNTLLVLFYIGHKVYERSGYFAYLTRSDTAKLGLIISIEQLIQIITMALAYTETISITKSYVHSTTITFVLFSLFFYNSTFVDVKGAIKANNESRTTENIESSIGKSLTSSINALMRKANGSKTFDETKKSASTINNQ